MSNGQGNQHDGLQNWKRNSNIATWGATIIQRGVVIICRSHWGTDAIGFPCAVALILMMVWAAFSRDIYMWVWIGIWAAFLGKRRKEAAQIAGQVDSRYDGYPYDAIRYCGSEGIAKRVVEPLLIMALAGILYWIYTEAGLPTYGLPSFLFVGAICTSLVEGVKQIAWDKRLRDMRNAQLENQQLVNEYEDRYGR